MLKHLFSRFQTIQRLSPTVHWRSVKQLTESYKKLSKAKLSTFVVFSTAAGFVVASKNEIASASANAWNQIYEVDRDAMMQRTRLRPLPLGRISIPHAIGLALISGITGVALLAHKVDDTAAALAAGNIFLYACIYTPLKQVTHLNTWIGAIVGAIPPLIGWTAASGYLDPGAWILFSALYFWQIPHFLSLSWTYKADYIQAGFRMLSRIDSTGRRTAAIAFRNCLYLLPLGHLSTYLGVTGKWFDVTSTIMTLMLALSASAFYQRPTKQLSRSLFKASILYLPLWLAAMTLNRSPDHISWQQLRCDADKALHYRPPKSIDQVDGWATNEDRSRLHLAFAPIPFAPLPTQHLPNDYLWAGLDDVIREFDTRQRTTERTSDRM